MLNHDEECVKRTLSSANFSCKIPVRIKSGAFRENCLFIVTSREEMEIDWPSIEYVCLGAIEELVGAGESPKSGMRNAMRKLFFGDKQQDDTVKPQKRVQYILDIYIRDKEAAYRFDSTNINYKSFLREVSYISFHNFKKLFKEICDRAQESCFNRSAVALLMKRQERIHKHCSVYDFELESQNCRLNLSREVHWNQVGKEIDYIFEDKGKMEHIEETGAIPEASFRVIEGVITETTPCGAPTKRLANEETSRDYDEEAEIIDDDEYQDEEWPQS